MANLTAPEWVEARDYQQEAIQNWMGAEGRGILRMATGTGKTVTALLAASSVAEMTDGPLLLVVAVPYQHLVDQWAADIREFGVNPVLAYESRRNWQPQLERELLEQNSGNRNATVMVTTHRTLSGQSPQQTILRAQAPSMLIGDEVHHMGAPQTQKALMDEFDLRLGLSATPERWYDDEGTDALDDYFNGTIFDYGLDRAIETGILCEYYYIPHIVELGDDEMEVYMRLTRKIGRLMAKADGDSPSMVLEGNEALQQALFSRARLIGTAQQKLDVLVDLFDRQATHSHSLVYCSDGTTGVDEDGERHVDATTHRLRQETDLNIERFTAREDQAERERLLSAFEKGEIEVLTSIRCLDEGVDVPATRTAYLLASTSNPRQYVQRRGRILRRHADKDFAVIHDFVTVPDTSRHPKILSDGQYEVERTLIRKELERVSTFTDSARNHPDAEVDGVPTTDGTLQKIKRRYNLLGA
ncbi:DEAD/DEAH box helicase family protein [Halococcoides cellulosivorans]|uniref:Type III restriction endonuclease subunit R n=1 Tax=Halococcoides cellulosivorans TaxID=1679096 RepID=A0A2R4X401_9EURY|nr:DEAD/DEAH box helicase family protein [Halococcoides cellulosivorans]AWB28518.1 type III restriction endonuclease subunit R [Halococcoides cellulosivorans]